MVDQRKRSVHVGRVELKPIYPKQSLEEIRRSYDRRVYGSLGPASPVKRIDPKTGSVVEVIEARSRS